MFILTHHYPFLYNNQDELTYKVEYFSGHVKCRTHKFKLVTKWVGWEEKDNTLEPLMEKAEESPELVVSYLLTNKENTADIVNYINNRKTGKSTFCSASMRVNEQ